MTGAKFVAILLRVVKSINTVDTFKVISHSWGMTQRNQLKKTETNQTTSGVTAQSTASDATNANAVGEQAGTGYTAEVESTVNTWGNGLAIRLPVAIAAAAGVGSGTPVQLLARSGSITITCSPSRRAAITKMQREISAELARPEDAIVEMALTRLHRNLFPAQYPAEVEDEFAEIVQSRSAAEKTAPVADKPAPASFNDSTLGNWLVAAKEVGKKAAH